MDIIKTTVITARAPPSHDDQRKVVTKAPKPTHTNTARPGVSNSQGKLKEEGDSIVMAGPLWLWVEADDMHSQDGPGRPASFELL